MKPRITKIFILAFLTFWGSLATEVVAARIVPVASQTDSLPAASSVTEGAATSIKKGKLTLKVGRPLQRNRTLIGPMYSSFAGFSMGARFFSSVPTAYFASNPDKPLDLGKGKPFLASLTFMIQPEESGLAFKVDLNGFLSTTYGFDFHFGAGYKLGGGVVSFTPTLSFGVGRLVTYLDGASIDSLIIPASLLSPGSPAYFVGLGAYNAGRGGGGNLNLHMGSAMFSLKPAVNLSFKVSPKLIFFTDFGLNIVARTKNEFKISGQGYDNATELNQAGLAPHAINIDTKAPSPLVGVYGETYTKNPVSPSGVQFSIGLGIPMD